MDGYSKSDGCSGTNSDGGNGIKSNCCGSTNRRRDGYARTESYLGCVREMLFLRDWKEVCKNAFQSLVQFGE